MKTKNWDDPPPPQPFSHEFISVFGKAVKENCSHCAKPVYKFLKIGVMLHDAKKRGKTPLEIPLKP